MPKKNFTINIGAPDPIVFRLRANTALVSLDSTLKFTYVNDAGTVTLGVGTGITLSDDEGVTNARATIQLTVAQSRAIPEGALTSYELQRTTSREEVMLSGMLVGQGGVNVDG